MNRKSISIVAILTLTITFILIIILKNPTSNKELHFAHWDGIIYSPEEQTTINLIGLSKQPIDKIQDSISNIKFDGKLLKIQNFNITASDDKYKGYTIFTIEIDGIMEEFSEETIHTVSITFNNKV